VTIKQRLLASLATGATTATILVAYEDKYRHAALAASAAQPLPDGGHETVASILAYGFIGVTVIVAAVAFIVSTVLARRSRARAFARQWRDGRDGLEPRRRVGIWR